MTTRFTPLIAGLFAAVTLAACSPDTAVAPKESTTSTAKSADTAHGPAKSIFVSGYTYSQLANYGNGMCLQPALGAGQSYGDIGLSVMQTYCDPSQPAQQMWTLVYIGTGPVAGRSGAYNLYEVVDLANGQCLDDRAGNTANGAAVQTYPCTGSLNEAWTKGRSVGASYSELVNSHSGKCLDDPQRSTTPGQLMWQWGCFGDLNPAQQWAFF